MNERSEPTAGCVGVVQVGGSILGRSHEVARVYAGASMNRSGFDAGIGIYLLGDKQPVWSREGNAAFSLPKWEKQYRTPTVEAPVAAIDPFEVDVMLYGDGVALVNAWVEPAQPRGPGFGCRAVLKPEAKAIATGGARVEPMPGIKQALELLVGDVSAGLEARVTLMDLALPGSLTLGVPLDARSGLPVELQQTDDLSFDADLLSGKLVAYLEIDLNDLWSLVAGLFGVDDSSQRWEWDLHDWPGEHIQMQLAHAESTISFVQ